MKIREILISLILMSTTLPCFPLTKKMDYAVFMNGLPLGIADLAITTSTDNKYDISLQMQDIIPGIPISGGLETEGKLVNGYPKPEQYSIRFTFNDLSEHKILRFDWPHHQLISSHKNKKKSIPDNTLDHLSALLALQHDLNQKGSTLSYAITDGKKPITYPLVKRGLKDIVTDNKTFKTIQLQTEDLNLNPQVSLWFSDDDQHTLVQAVFTFDESLVIKAILKT